MLSPFSRASAADQFGISAAQVEALGVTLQRLDQPAEIHGLAYPARVVLPPQQERIASAPVAGVVDQLLVEEYQRVEVGQPLLRLNSPEFGALQLDALAAANKDRLAQEGVVRERDLLADGIIAARRSKEAEAAASDSQAALKQARATLRLAGLREKEIARLMESGTIQDALVVRARSAGVVVGLEVKPGQRVAAADPLVRTADMSRLWLDIQLPSEQATSWSKESLITVVGRKVSATPLYLGAMVGEGQTLNLRSEVKSGAELLRPGEFVQALVPLGGGRGTWTIPLLAVVRKGEQAYVFVRTAEGFSARPVSVLASSDQSVRIEAELKPDDQIAVTRVTALKAAWLGGEGN